MASLESSIFPFQAVARIEERKQIRIVSMKTMFMAHTIGDQWRMENMATMTLWKSKIIMIIMNADMV